MALSNKSKSNNKSDLVCSECESSCVQLVVDASQKAKGEENTNTQKQKKGKQNKNTDAVPVYLCSCEYPVLWCGDCYRENSKNNLPFCSPLTAVAASLTSVSLVGSSEKEKEKDKKRQRKGNTWNYHETHLVLAIRSLEDLFEFTVTSTCSLPQDDEDPFFGGGGGSEFSPEDDHEFSSGHELEEEEAHFWMGSRGLLDDELCSTFFPEPSSYDRAKGTQNEGMEAIEAKNPPTEISHPLAITLEKLWDFQNVSVPRLLHRYRPIVLR